MSGYLRVIILTLVLSVAMKKTRCGPLYSLSNRAYYRTLQFFIFLTMTLFLGLRTSYNDTFVYLIMYERVSAFPSFWETFDPRISQYPGFMIVQAFLRTYDVSGQGFLLIFTSVAIASILIFLKKNSCDYTLSLFLLFATNVYTFTAAAMKQVAAISIGLIAIIFALKGKWGAFIVTVLIAAMFHPYVLLFGLVPFFMFRPWSKPTYLLLGMAFIAGIMLESLLGTIIDITEMIGDAYTEEELMGEGINIFRVMVANVPLILSLMYKDILFRNSTKAENLMVNLTMLNGAIMFIGLFGNSIYFSRLANYFTIFSCVSLPWIIHHLPGSRKSFFSAALVAGYIGFFIYANMINQSFDANFSRITLWQYLTNYIFE